MHIRELKEPLSCSPSMRHMVEPTQPILTKPQLCHVYDLYIVRSSRGSCGEQPVHLNKCGLLFHSCQLVCWALTSFLCFIYHFRYFPKDKSALHVVLWKSWCIGNCNGIIGFVWQQFLTLCLFKGRRTSNHIVNTLSENFRSTLKNIWVNEMMLFFLHLFIYTKIHLKKKKFNYYNSLMQLFHDEPVFNF